MADTGKTRTLLPKLTAKTLAGFLRLVGRTSTFVYDPKDCIERTRDDQPVIYAFWHGQFLLIPLIRLMDVPTGVMVARHEDADILSSVLEEFELELIRGAGSGARKRDRGGATALRASLTALKAGTSIALTADVPPGPARRLGEGIITLARLSGRPIVTVTAASNRFRTLNTWSRMTVNLPFSTIGVTAGEPIHVPRSGTNDDYEKIRKDLETQLSDLTTRAYQLAGAENNPRAPLTGRPTPPGMAARIYRIVTRTLEPIGPHILNRRAKRGKEDPARQNERLGRPSLPRPEGRIAWFHAASVGELNAIRPLLHEINLRHPELNLLVTTGTVTSAKIAIDHLTDIALHQYIPIDGPRMVRNFLDHWKPDVAFLVESEIWPNLIYETSTKKIPLILLNATLSAKSANAWRKVFRKRTAASLFTRFDLILAQTSASLLRFARLGAMNVEVVGNLKIDASPQEINSDNLTALRSQIEVRPVFVAASTHPGEEEQIAEAHKIIRKKTSDILTVIVPRHPARGEDIVNTLKAEGLSIARRSLKQDISDETDIYIADTLGETGLFYSVSNVTFMGGSLVPHGGQNPIEPIRLGAPVVTGPHTHNFEAIIDSLDRHDGIVRVANAEELAASVLRLLAQPDDAIRMISNAANALTELDGALEQTLSRITPYLGSTPTQPQARSDAS